MAEVGHTRAFYHPEQGDLVIGIVERRSNDDWMVDIGYSHTALLPQLAFDNVTKRNAPKFGRGDLVLAFVDDVPDAGETLISCVPRKQKETLGPLKGGMLIRMRPKDLEKLEASGIVKSIVDKRIPLRVAFAKNGRAFIDTGSASVTVQIAHCITEAVKAENTLECFEGLLAQVDLSSVSKPK